MFGTALLLLLVLTNGIVWTSAFPILGLVRPTRVRSTVVLELVPLREFEDISFLSTSDSYRTCIDENGELRSNDDEEEAYVLCVAEEDDLPAISKMVVESFGSEAIVLSSETLSPWEQALVQPGVNLLNAYSGAVAYAEVLSGLRYRMKYRFSNNNNNDATRKKNNLISCPEDDSLADTSSLILALARKSHKDTEVLGGMDVLATVELRLQPTDAKIPFSYPWLDTLERNLGRFVSLSEDTSKTSAYQPYLSNLCVAEQVRGRRIGKALVRCVESIATHTWGYSKLYLHVDLQNVAAYSLYKKEGYTDVGSRWNPFWAGSAADIAYFVKKLE